MSFHNFKVAVYGRVALRSLIGGAVLLLGGPIMPSSAQARQEMPAQSQTGKVTIPARTMAAYCLKAITPIYAGGAAPGAKPTSVTLEVVISRAGTVRPVRIVSGEASLALAAMDAVRLWRYRPYLVNGEPVEVSTQVQLDFIPGRPGGLITHPANAG